MDLIVKIRCMSGMVLLGLLLFATMEEIRTKKESKEPRHCVENGLEEAVCQHEYFVF